MEQVFSISISKEEFNKLINEAIEFAFEKKLSSPKGSDLLSIEEAADYMKCSTVFIWKLRKSGKLKSIGAGKRVYFRKSTLDAFLDGKTMEVANG